MTHHDLSPEADRDHVEKAGVPAGGAGADSGATDAVGVDAHDTADVQNVSSQNDIPGVGTRGGVESAAAEASPAGPERPRPVDPGFARADEDAGAAHHNARVSARDARDVPRARVDGGAQHRPRMAQNAPTHEEEVAGIVAQTRADLALGIAPERAGDILLQRLADAGIECDDAELGELVRRVNDGD